MIIVNLTGGLGNQLFQYAFGKYLAVENNCELKLDVSSYENYEWHDYSLSPFKINEIFASPEECQSFKGTGLNFFQKIYRKLLRLNYLVAEDTFQFNPNYKLKKAPIYLDGYWQSENYFKEIETIIRKEFIVKKAPSYKNQTLIEKIQHENAVSLHIRRGNYVNVSHVNETHGTSSLEYYKSAVDIISSKEASPIFYIFSDDISWAKNNLNLDFETVFVDINDAKSDYEDLRLMFTCKHNIIANSTFSWWGAWLNTNSKKIVIAPKVWFNDIDLNNQTDYLIPSEWLRI
jgi:hypothetical protein